MNNYGDVGRAHTYLRLGLDNFVNEMFETKTGEKNYTWIVKMTVGHVVRSEQTGMLTCCEHQSVETKTSEKYLLDHFFFFFLSATETKA